MRMCLKAIPAVLATAVGCMLVPCLAGAQKISASSAADPNMTVMPDDSASYVLVWRTRRNVLVRVRGRELERRGSKDLMVPRTQHAELTPAAVQAALTAGRRERSSDLCSGVPSEVVRVPLVNSPGDTLRVSCGTGSAAADGQVVVLRHTEPAATRAHGIAAMRPQDVRRVLNAMRHKADSLTGSR
jgi:hypothetical protein